MGKEHIMTVKALSFVFLFVVMLGCSGGHSDSTQTPAPPSTQTPAPPSAKQFRVTGVGKVNFPNGDSALVLNYETDIPIEDRESLRKEVDRIWETFRNDVEKAQLKSGVIRATHYESTGLLRQGKGYGFVFTKGDDGKWRSLDDDKQKK
jgi:hypothetical protein